MLVITYTSEHNHPWPTQRNALAGSTRSQPLKNNNNSNTVPKGSSSSQRTRSIKEEQKDSTSANDTPSSNASVKEEIGEIEKPIENFEFQQEFVNGEYIPIMPDSQASPDDFLGDLVELETDPLNLIFSKGFTADQESRQDEEKGTSPWIHSISLIGVVAHLGRLGGVYSKTLEQKIYIYRHHLKSFIYQNLMEYIKFMVQYLFKDLVINLHF
ncbi:putative WRKY transcription factor 14 [Acorus calamus]|uniref:WRKY transcription factor 14 n=1 Tax=Acorus calamus TaxID=4465 RepID=A0AAV9FM41_ACOCL|nr:putative WRKY transcription factor 14 [Acorus calamus]